MTKQGGAISASWAGPFCFMCLSCWVYCGTAACREAFQKALTAWWLDVVISYLFTTTQDLRRGNSSLLINRLSAETKVLKWIIIRWFSSSAGSDISESAITIYLQPVCCVSFLSTLRTISLLVLQCIRSLFRINLVYASEIDCIQMKE